MINFALFGAGGIGSYHLAAIERQEKKGRARLLAVADPMADRNPGRRAELERRGVRWHLDYRDLLHREEDIQAVVIATPIPLHYEMAKACLERDFFINLEKPPVPLIGQLESLIAAEKSPRVSVGFQMIGSRGLQALKTLIVEEKIGTVREIRAGGCWPRLDSYYARARWAGMLTLDGEPVLDGPATNALAHLIHDIMFLASRERDEFAVPLDVEGELYRARRIESYDIACLRGHFADDLAFSVAVTHATQRPLPFRVEVFGTKGWATLSDDGALLASSESLPLESRETTQQLIDHDYDHFLDVIEGRKKRFQTGLKDTRGYVSATNGMFLSSGAIHDLDPAYTRPGEGVDEGGFDVLHLHEAVQESLRSGLLFSEQKCFWAVAAPTSISLDSPDLGRRMAESFLGKGRFEEPIPAAETGFRI